jgi:hypothetical protein
MPARAPGESLAALEMVPMGRRKGAPLPANRARWFFRQALRKLRPQKLNFAIGEPLCS